MAKGPAQAFASEYVERIQQHFKAGESITIPASVLQLYIEVAYHQGAIATIREERDRLNAAIAWPISTHGEAVLCLHCTSPHDANIICWAHPDYVGRDLQ